jgi:hypothetical protein
METNPEIARPMLAEFHRIWTLEHLQAMTLEEYVGVGNKYTFTQYAEHRTKPLGSINGKDSSKFGIWERKDPSNLKGIYTNKGKYSWPKRFPFTDTKEAFAAVKEEILFIVNAAREGDFAAIDQTQYLSDIYKWKVAYLYSTERLVSVFSREVLQRIASSYQLPRQGRWVPVSVIQQAMMGHKPFHMSIYEYSDFLFQQFATPKEKKDEDSGRDGNGEGGAGTRGGKRTKRKAAEGKNTTGYMRKSSADTFVNQEHNRLQELLRDQLKRQYGPSAVLMEHNYVDLKVQTDHGSMLYEVKSAGYASECVEEALGQILRYAFHQADGQEDAIQLVIAGKYLPNESDSAYINFVKRQFSIQLDYIAIEQ